MNASASPILLRALAIADGCPDEFLSRMAELTKLRADLRTRRKTTSEERKAITAAADAYGNLAMKLHDLHIIVGARR